MKESGPCHPRYLPYSSLCASLRARYYLPTFSSNTHTCPFSSEPQFQPTALVKRNQRENPNEVFLFEQQLSVPF